MSSFLKQNGLNVEMRESFLQEHEADAFFEEFFRYKFDQPQLTIRGKVVKPRRHHLGFGDPGVEYAFSGTTVPGLPWTPALAQLKERVESQLEKSFNFALMNLYYDENSSIGAHADNETCLDEKMPVACVSLGATRKMEFTREGFEKVVLPLNHGALYILWPPTNEFYKHGIPADPSEISGPRISVTFRKIDSTPPPKRRKMELPEWHSKSTSRIFARPTVVWDLGSNVQATLIVKNNCVRMQMSEMRKTQTAGLKPSFNTIYITPPTWKVLYDTVLKDQRKARIQSLIVNNQLAMFLQEGNEIILQQIFRNESYSLKSNFLKITRDHLEKLDEYSFEITREMKKIVLCDLLPIHLTNMKKSCQHSTHDSPIECENHIMLALKKEMKKHASEDFRCSTCVSDRYDFSNSHDCLTTNNFEKYFMTGASDLILKVNSLKVAKQIYDSICVCHLNNDEFYDSLSFDKYMEYFNC